MTLKPEYVKFMPKTLEVGVLYISKEFGSVLHLCACGCGRKSVTPIAPFWKDGWVLKEEGDKVTLSPSILNKVCKAHYWIRANEVVWA